METIIPIYWIFEGKEYDGYAVYNEASENDNAFITYESAENKALERLDAYQLEGGEDELREIWEDLLSDAEASEDGRLDVTNSSLT